MGVRKHSGSKVITNKCANPGAGTRRAAPPCKISRIHGDREFKSLREEGSSVCQPHPQGFITQMFLVPNKDGSHRPIIDLRELNSFIHWEHFKSEGIHLVKDLLQENNWLVKLDLKHLFCNPNSQTSLPWPAIPLDGKDTPIQLPSLWPLLSSSHVHEDNATCSSLLETTRVQDDYKHRRQPPYGNLKGWSSPPSRLVKENIGSPWFCDNHLESALKPCQGI